MPSVFLAPTFGVGYQSFTDGGLPNNAGYIATYIANGTTPQATYTTAAGDVLNANPVVLSASGRPPSEIWLIVGQSYRFDLFDADGNLLKSYHDIAGGSGDFNIITTNNLTVGGDTQLGDVTTGGSTNITLGDTDTFTIENIGGDTILQITEDGTTTINVPAGEEFHVTGDGDAVFDTDAYFNEIIFLGGVNILDLINAAAGASGGFSSSGLVARNNIANPNTQFDISADAIVLSNPLTSESTFIGTPANQTNNTSTAGPIAGGRDQAGAFSVSSWVHFYWIYNSTTETLSTISSAVDQTTGPTLPSGYDYWGYIGPVRFNGSSQLEAMYFVNNFAYRQVNLGNNAVNGGTAGSQTAVDISALIPPNSPVMEISAQLATNGGAGSSSVWVLNMGFITGLIFTYVGASTAASAGTGEASYITFSMPNLNQNLYYYTALASGSTNQGTAYIAVTGYSIPNNGA